MAFTRRSFLASTGLSAVATAGAAAARETDAWALPHADSHNTNHTSLPAVEGTLQVGWKRSHDAAVSTTPSYLDSRVYLGTEAGRVVALDAAGGEAAWSRSLSHTPSLFVTAAANGLFVPTREGVLYSLESAGGDRRWRHDVGEPIESPATTDGDVVLLGTEDGRVLALDAATGNERWTRAFQTGVRTVPAISGDAVVVRDDDGVVAALDRSTGQERWRRRSQTGLPAGAFRGPVVRDGTVYTSGSAEGDPTDRRLLALDLASGTTRWEQPIKGAVHHLVSTPETLFSLHGDGIYALDPADGDTRWLARQRGPVTFASVPGTLYVVSRDAVTVYDSADGSVRDRFDPGVGLFGALPMDDQGPPLAGGPTPIPSGLVVTDADGTVWAIRGGGIPDYVFAAVGLGLFGVVAYALRRFKRDAERANDQ